MLGVYIHVPFCASKCPYCDFYSIPLPSDDILDAYTETVCRRLEADVQGPFDTLYFGGGTPSLLGGNRLNAILRTARCVGLTDDAEVTLEANPADRLYDTFAAFAQAGGNRVSMGMQAATAAALRSLGRRHTPSQLEAAVHDLHRAGIDNLSLDLMLATPSQTVGDIDRAASVCVDYGATHVSAYLLKIEPHTPFGEHPPVLPDEDTASDLYLHACRTLEAAGYAQYEISNFAKDGKQSRHNLKYWTGEPYIGIGPAAHSFVGGQRYFMPRSLEAFLGGATPSVDVSDDAAESGSEDEWAMLRLRLTDGITARAYEARFSRELPEAWIRAAQNLPRSLVRVDQNGIALTAEGFLLSNALIARILWSE